VDKPKPKCWICDSVGGFDSGEFTKESANLNIGIQLTPGQSPWAHGKLERMVKRVKNTFYLMQTDLPDVDPKLIYYMALGAVNRQEVVRGFTPVQWCYGKHDDQDDIESEERRHLQGADVSKSDFAELQKNRNLADQAFHRAKALERVSILANAKTRQPLRQFAVGDWCKIWRRKPHHGFNKPHWWGPGRIVMQETLPSDNGHDQARRHIVWVLLGTRMIRCSVYSVRPLSGYERVLAEV
jgi:hypothetical protein